MTTREKSPTVLTAAREAAQHRVRVIRNALEVADEELVKAYEARDWETLGYDSFEAYCVGELPGLRTMTLRAPARRARAHALRAKGATIPEIVVATGSSLGSIHRDLTPRKPAPSFQMETPAPPLVPVERLAKWQTVVRHVAAAGAAGLTCLEFERQTGWRHGASSAAFHSAQRKGYVRRGGTFRGGYGTYVSSLRP